jgi:peptidyl-tRNA hydrolase, PTH1 family
MISIMAYIIVGLGNPGTEYENTRHNTGRLALLALVEKKIKGAKFSEWKNDKKINAEKCDGLIGKEKVTLILPNTFMNNSGKALKELINSEKKAEKLIIVHDDLDLPLGKVKMSFNRSSGGHKGVESIIKNIKTQKFSRIRIGVSPTTPTGKLRKPSDEEKLLDFIVGELKPTETAIFKKVFEKIFSVLITFTKLGREQAMGECNTV